MNFQKNWPLGKPANNKAFGLPQWLRRNLTLSLALNLALGIAATNIACAADISEAGKPDIKIKSPLIPVNKDFKLANGLRVVLSEDHSVPVVSVAIVYDVGARDEVKKRSGFAHLFEHMMFQGSENVGKMDHF